MGKKEAILKKHILGALKSVEGVIIPSDYDNHGFQEFGIDIVFDYPDAFGQVRKYGIQVKDEDIDSDVIQKVLGQLSVAFGHKYSLDPDKYLDAVFENNENKKQHPMLIRFEHRDFYSFPSFASQILQLRTL